MLISAHFYINRYQTNLKLGSEQILIGPNEVTPVQGTKISTLGVIHPSFSLSIDIMPVEQAKFVDTKWSNILHVTKDYDKANPGDRMPA